MNVKLITLHRVMNYGSVLQTYASQKFLLDCGLNTEVIDYYRPQDLRKEDVSGLLVYMRACKNRENGKFSLKQEMKAVLQYATNKKHKAIFDSFIEKNIKLTKSDYYNLAGLNELNNNTDCFCTGSDQVWNYEYNQGYNPVFYLEFAAPTKKKISLSSSMGCASFGENRKEILHALKQYAVVSVREKQTSEMFLDEGIDNTLLLDPTLLIDKNDWKKLASPRLIREKYLLLYGFNISDEMVNYAEWISDKLKLRIVRIGLAVYHKILYKNVWTLPTTEDFLSLFLYCDFVVTNSFHGTAFSINFSKNFRVFLRDKYNIRMNSITELFDLQEVCITENDAATEKIKSIDYKAVAKKLEDERLKAKRIFQQINGEKDEAGNK